MAAQHDHNDRLADQNLRRIGKLLEVPQPTARQRQHWKSTSSDSRPDQAHNHRLRAGGLSVQARRFITFSVSAVAAALALVAFIFVPPLGSRVEAAMILRSLRETTHNGFKLELNNVRVEGVNADFRMLLRFPQPINLAQLASDGGAKVEPDAFYLDGTVRLPLDCEEAPGMAIELALAARENDQWLYTKMQNIPIEELGNDDPQARRVIDAVMKRLGDGLVLDLTGLKDLLEQADMFENALSVDVGTPDADGETGNVNVSVTQHVKVTTAASADKHETDDAAKHEIKLGLLGLGPIGEEIAEALDEAADEIQTGFAAEVKAGQGEWEKRVSEIAEAILTGRATQTQLESLIADIEKFAGHASVTQGNDGVWTLNVSEFDTTGMDDDERAMLEHASLSVRYRELDGVLSAELLHFGEADGRLSFEFIDGIDETLLDRTRYIDRGVPMLDLRNPWQIMTFFGDVFTTTDDE